MNQALLAKLILCERSLDSLRKLGGFGEGENCRVAYANAAIAIGRALLIGIGVDGCWGAEGELGVTAVARTCILVFG